MKKHFGLIAFISYIILITASCARDDASILVGNWILEDGQNFFGIIEDYKLLKDGTGIVDSGYGYSGSDILWKVEDGFFKISYISKSIEYELEYKISGKNLIITVEDINYLYKKSEGKNKKFGNWRSYIKIDQVTNKKELFFRNISVEDEIELLIRLRDGKLEMLVGWSVELGSTRNVTLQIDDKKPETKNWLASTFGEVLFYPDDDVISLLNIFLDAKQMIITCTPQNGSTITALFNIQEFRKIALQYEDIYEIKKFTHKIEQKQPEATNQKSSGRVSSFPGRWYLFEGSKNYPDNVDLLKDGTGIADDAGFSWKLENGRFYIIHPFFGLSAIYNISDTTLTLTKDDGEIIIYKRK